MRITISKVNVFKSGVGDILGFIFQSHFKDAYYTKLGLQQIDRLIESFLCSLTNIEENFNRKDKKDNINKILNYSIVVARCS